MEGTQVFRICQRETGKPVASWCLALERAVNCCEDTSTSLPLLDCPSSGPSEQRILPPPSLYRRYLLRYLTSPRHPRLLSPGDDGSWV